MARHRALTGHLCAIAVILMWGLTFVSSKVLLADFTPVEILFDRFVVALLALLAIAPKALRFHGWRAEGYAALAGLFGITIYFVCENTALIYSSSANVSLIVSMAPLFVALLNLIIDRSTHLGWPFALGFLLAMSGVGVLTLGSLELSLNPLGDALALAAAVEWGLYSLCLVKLQRLGLGSVEITAKTFLYSLILTVPLMGGYELKWERLCDPTNALNLLFLGVLASSLCFFAWSHAVALIGSVRTNIYIYAIPVITAAGATLLIAEPITMHLILGAALALGGLALSQAGTRRKAG
ncbi:MAG: DMT family transporter [Succinivibrionaceae bacterium]|nr:DMT family transporter [Succinivibrionaceae bacterium]